MASREDRDKMTDALREIYEGKVEVRSEPKRGLYGRQKTVKERSDDAVAAIAEAIRSGRSVKKSSDL